MDYAAELGYGDFIDDVIVTLRGKIDKI